MPYLVRFENDPDKATAPAQIVTIEVELDSQLDWQSLELDEVGFGDLSIVVPSGLQEYATSVDYHNEDGSPLRVDVHAALDQQTGSLRWEFRSLDPATGLAPDGVYDGFLPVNADDHRGEGYVSYRIRSQTPLADGKSDHGSGRNRV